MCIQRSSLSSPFWQLVLFPWCSFFWFLKTSNVILVILCFLTFYLVFLSFLCFDWFYQVVSFVQHLALFPEDFSIWLWFLSSKLILAGPSSHSAMNCNSSLQIVSFYSIHLTNWSWFYYQRESCFFCGFSNLYRMFEFDGITWASGSFQRVHLVWNHLRASRTSDCSRPLCSMVDFYSCSCNWSLPSASGMAGLCHKSSWICLFALFRWCLGMSFEMYLSFPNSTCSWPFCFFQFWIYRKATLGCCISSATWTSTTSQTQSMTCSNWVTGHRA